MQSIHFPVGMDHLHGLSGIEELDSDYARIGEFAVAVTALNHPGGCSGFRIEARGASVAYLPDHEPYDASFGPAPREKIHPLTKALMRFIEGVDLLVLDTQYTEREYRNRIGWGHGCLPNSVALAMGAGVRHLLFFHHDPSHHDDQVDAMIDEARKLAGPSELLVEAAAENRIITLDHVSVRRSLAQVG
jgi:phosphoribosyl 1,2-cyclic phosphodiesterase